MARKISVPRHTRREALIKSAAAALAMGISTPGVLFAQATPTLTPGETQGPYWLDTNVNRSDIRTNSSNGVASVGLKMTIAVNVSQLSGNIVTPVPNAKVDIWHANAFGKYSGFSAEGTLGQDFLRGYQNTNGHGTSKFVSVYPGYYNGRTVHIHFRVRLYSGATVTYNFVSQFYLNDATSTTIYTNCSPYNTRPARTIVNTNDMVYTGPSQGNGGQVASNSGAYLLLRMAKNDGSVLGSFNVVL